MTPELILETPVLDDEATEPKDDENVLRVMDRELGDRKIKWKPGNSASVKKAKAKFEELRSKGYAFFRVTRVRVKADEFPETAGAIVATKKDLASLPAEVEGEQIRKFEVTTRETVAVPPRSGG